MCALSELNLLKNKMKFNGNRTLAILLLCALQIFGDHISTTNEGTVNLNESTSNEPKSVPLIADHPNHVHAVKSTPIKSDNFTNLLRLEDVLMVFDLNELAAKWQNVKHEFKSDCSESMTMYFRGLQHRKMWATKSKCSFSIFFCHSRFFFF